MSAPDLSTILANAEQHAPQGGSDLFSTILANAGQHAAAHAQTPDLFSFDLGLASSEHAGSHPAAATVLDAAAAHAPVQLPDFASLTGLDFFIHT